MDNRVDAQPLYLSKLSIGGVQHNVVFVETESDSAYAFDADTGTQLWKTPLTLAGESPSDIDTSTGCNQIGTTIGVTSTPVIARTAGAHGVIYMVAMSVDAMGNSHHRLHALDVTTGAEVSGSPVEITGSYKTSTFLPVGYEARAALVLSNGTIYVAFTSHCDAPIPPSSKPYGGWVFAFNQSTLAISGIINLAAGATGSAYDTQGPAIWMAGAGLAADAAGSVYLLTGNGRFDTSFDGNGFPVSGDYGNSFVKLAFAAGALSVADYFTNTNLISESGSDTDLGSGGILLLPDLTDASGTHHLAIGAGKDGQMYVVNRDAMGHDAGMGTAAQQIALNNSVFSSPAYFNGTIYYGAVGSPLQAIPITGATVATSASSQTSKSFAYPGTFPVISANGTTNAIVWLHENSGTAVLHAFNAANLAQELYNSNQAASNRDHFGTGNKFIAPAVADGKVFVGTTNSVAVFGLLH